MLHSTTEDSDNLLNRERKEMVNLWFSPWMIGSNVLTMLYPLFGSQIVKVLSLFHSKLKWEKDGVGGRSNLFHIRSIRSGWSGRDNGRGWGNERAFVGAGGSFFRCLSCRTSWT